MRVPTATEYPLLPTTAPLARRGRLEPLGVYLFFDLVFGVAATKSSFVCSGFGRLGVLFLLLLGLGAPANPSFICEVRSGTSGVYTFIGLNTVPFLRITFALKLPSAQK